MTKIGATIRSTRSSSPELVAIHDVVVPDFILKAQDESRELVSGWCVDDQNAINEHAISFNEETDCAEFHVLDIGSVALVPSIRAGVKSRHADSQSSASLNTALLMKVHIGQANLVLSGLPTPTITVGIQDSKFAYLKSTRLEAQEMLDPRRTFYVKYGKMRSDIGRSIGQEIPKTENIILVRKSLSRMATEQLTEVLFDTTFALEGTGRFHRPLRRTEDFINGLTLSGLANRDYELALSNAELFDDYTLDILAKSIGYIQRNAGYDKSVLSKVIDFWDDPSDEATLAIKDVLAFENDLSLKNNSMSELKLEVEKLVIESAQTVHRMDTHTTFTAGSLRRNIYKVTDPEARLLEANFKRLTGGIWKK